ncbi:hypothetical protein ACFOPX_02935 [Helicobacter baculiformis]|uniref:Uncharacterized protein n=1 Tax=Helicobacter baculiformis TaxID=427351 RepID=A0ABV7ZG46_9HELI|nr:hypothetical protein [Helicobacter baculiformis]
MKLSLKTKQYIHAILFLVWMGVGVEFMIHFDKIRHWLWWEHTLFAFGIGGLLSLVYVLFKLDLKPEQWLPWKPMLLLGALIIPIIVVVTGELGW